MWTSICERGGPLLRVDVLAAAIGRALDRLREVRFAVAQHLVKAAPGGAGAGVGRVIRLMVVRMLPRTLVPRGLVWTAAWRRRRRRSRSLPVQVLDCRRVIDDPVQVYLRVIRGSGEPSKYDEFTRLAEESIARLKTRPGFAGYYAAGNRETGSFLTVTIWQTEEGANAPLQDIVGDLLQRVHELGARMERPETFEVLRSS